MAPSTTDAARAHGALLAGLAALALLALLTTWIAALARVPQQRAAVERLLRAQTGLEVRYGRLAVRLGFYGPEAEFGNVEMRRPGATAPLLRAPRMVARFESWRLLRGGQLRPGRVMISGAELDLRQLLELRRGNAGPSAAAYAPAATGRGGAAAADAGGALQDLESQLPRLLAGIPQGSLDFEAVTLSWSAAAGGGEALQLRAPRLHASRRIDGAQLSGTLLLPARLGRTLFVTAQLRDGGAGGGGLQGRLRLSGRGLVLAQWREAGILPDWLGSGVGDLALAAQLRDGRVLRADGEARLAGLGLATPAPLVARRFGVAAADFSYDRLPGARRYRLLQVEMTPTGGATQLFGERGTLELRLGDAAGPGSLVARRIPVELLAFLAARAGTPAWPEAPPLRLTGGALESFEARWPAARDGAAPATLRGRLLGLTLGSGDGRWSVDGVDAAFAGEGGYLRLQLQARDGVLRAPWLEALPVPQRVTFVGQATLGASPAGWSAALEDLDLSLADGPRLRLSGAAGAAIAGAAQASELRMVLLEPLERERMALLQQALAPWLTPASWQRFEAGTLAAASVEFEAGRLRAARAALRAADFAAADPVPRAIAVDLDLAWEDDRLEGRALGGRLGALVLESGRVSWSPSPATTGASSRRGAAPRRPRLELEARLAGSIREALEFARVAAPPGDALAGIEGRAQLAALWREPEVDAPLARARALQLDVDLAQARWQLVPDVAALEGLEGRLRADGRGLRDGRVAGRWLGGPVELRLDGAAPGGLRITAAGRIARAALRREWAWIELVERGERDTIDWTAEARADPDAAAPEAPAARADRAVGIARRASTPAGPNDAATIAADPATPWRVRIALPGRARADLRWAPADAAWRLDRGTVQFGDGAALAGIPGALVVGGRIERLDLGGLAGAFDGAAGGGWQRPLVGEVAVDELDLGALRLGAARLRLAGSRESTSVDLEGPAVAGELRQRHDEPGVLRARFARLQLPADGPFASLPLAAGPLRGTLELRVADLLRGTRSLGELAATLVLDDAAVATRDLVLRRGAQRLDASGRCERATLGCNAEIVLTGAELGALQRDLGAAARLQGEEVNAVGRLGWNMAQGARFAAGLQGELELQAMLTGYAERYGPAGAASPGGAGSESGANVRGDAAPDGPAWSLLAPLLAVAVRQAEDGAARDAALAAAAGAATRGAGTGSGTGTGGGAGTGAGAGEGATPAMPAGATTTESRPGTPTAAPALPFERLDLRLVFEDGVGRIERYEAVGRDARLSVAGRFDFRRDTLVQQADWYWIAPGVSGAVERLDPRSPLAAGLRTLRELLAREPRGAATAPGAVGAARAGSVERFVLEGSLGEPRVERPALLDSAR